MRLTMRLVLGAGFVFFLGGAGGCGALYGPCLAGGGADPMPDDEHVDCIQVYEPVCGCDGRTYSNSCFAGVAGVVIAHDGTCRRLDQMLLPLR